MILLDDHLVRDLVGRRLPASLSADERDVATTNLWLFRLVGSLTREAGGSLTRLVDDAAEFRLELATRLEELAVVPMEHLVWSMAELREHHRAANRPMSTAMLEVLAAAHHLDAQIAVAAVDVGSNLRASAEADGIVFRVIEP